MYWVRRHYTNYKQLTLTFRKAKVYIWTAVTSSHHSSYPHQTVNAEFKVVDYTLAHTMQRNFVEVKRTNYERVSREEEKR